VSDSKKLPRKIEETDDGQILFKVPFPAELNEESLASLKRMSPIILKHPYQIDYIHSYGQDSAFFAALTNKVFLGSRDRQTGYTYANPRGHDMYTGEETDWVVLPNEGTIHAFTVCHFGSEAFLPQTPFVLILVEFEGTDTLFLSRMVGVDPNQASLDWIGMRVEAQYLRNSKFKPTDVYFAPASEAE
jgi:uncharacterized OB-fold protein